MVTEEAMGDGHRAGEIPSAPGAPPPGSGNSSDPLGLVVGTVPATPLQFSVGLAPGQYVQLDDVVVTRRELPGQPGVQISGVVTNVEALHEGARFASDVFLIEQGALPAEVSEVAEVTVTRVEPELYVPPLPGVPVRRAVGAQRESALYFDEMGASKVPVGFGSPYTSISSSLMAPGARMCRSLGCRGSRRRPRSRCSCCTRSFTAGCWRVRRTTPRC